MVAVISIRYTRREEIVAGEYYALLLFAALGMMVMVSSTSFVTIFIGLEVMSLSIYILCGLLKGQARAVESSFKYFLLGAFATAFFLYGIALVFASTGAIDIRMVRTVASARNLGVDPVFLTGMALLIVGFGFKTASVPFHMWTPDVYEGAPTPVTVFMATGVKAAAFAAFLRVFYTAFYPFIGSWSSVLWLIAVLTMCVGNITALVQNNMKRLLAYSSIAHAGYILVAFVTGDRVLSSSILYYLLAYTFMNLGAFTVVILLGRKGEAHEDIDSYAGLAGRHPFVSLCMTIFLLSLTGIPPLAGFTGKFYIFSDAIKGQYYWLAVIGVLNSAVAAYYYLRVLMYMYFKEPVNGAGRGGHVARLCAGDAGQRGHAVLSGDVSEGGGAVGPKIGRNIPIEGAGRVNFAPGTVAGASSGSSHTNGVCSGPDDAPASHHPSKIPPAGDHCNYSHECNKKEVIKQ